MATSEATKQSATPATGCPICGRPAAADTRPFCSRRCADVDLARWMSGAYAIPGRVEVDEDGDADNQPEGPLTATGERG
jgi:endogenous inhibitor of DNA gyrase (YacG/DUF329 family)